MRCFIGIPLTGQVRKELVLLQKKLGKAKTHMKIVEPENLHITMKFLGETDEKKLEKTKNVLKGLNDSVFEIKFTHLGAFPSKSYIRVLWAGIGKGKEKLKSIHDKIAYEKAYEPHVTLARLKSRPDDMIMKTIEEKLDLNMTVDRVQLIESVLSPTGPKYSKVFEVELG